MLTGSAQRTLNDLTDLVLVDVALKRFAADNREQNADQIADFVASEADKLKVVYTAFDGDHQMMSGLMRRRAITDDRVPANPDSILGYKETVEYRKTKRKVLLDDLSVLRGCEELWVFSDERAVPNSCPRLAEGLLVELLFFLKRYPTRPVKFFPISQLLRDAKAAEPVPWTATYQDTVSALGEDQRNEVLQLANSGTQVDNELVNLKYYLLDPLDYKYSCFVRANGYRKTYAPIIPYLAVHIEDFDGDPVGPARALICWAKLLSLATSLVKLPSLEPGRAESLICQILERIWLRRLGGNRALEEEWGDFGVPKAQQEDKWAITQKERRAFLRSED